MLSTRVRFERLFLLLILSHVAAVGAGGGGVFPASILMAFFPLAAPSNWAQLGGWNRQNSAWSAPPPHNLTRRHSFASTVIQQHVIDLGSKAGGGGNTRIGDSPSPSPVPKYSAPSKLFILGGDDFARDVRTNKDFGSKIDGIRLDTNYPENDMATPLSGSGGLKNDIFWTGGSSTGNPNKFFKIFADYRLRNEIGGATPSLVSTMNWTQIKPWEGIGDYQSWKDYLGCTHRDKPFPCTDENRLMKDGSDPLRFKRRWSPRRGASAGVIAYVDDQPSVMFIIGGRAKSYEQTLSVNDARGGLQTFSGSGVQARADDVSLVHRERTVLTNDVWVSYDEGETWDFTNAGCWGRNAPGGEVPMNSAREFKNYQKYPGVELQRCTTDEDCYKKYFGRSSVCQTVGKGNKQKMCVCEHFSPREYAAVAATAGLGGTPAIYISGGVGEIQRNMCGDKSCGRDQSVFFRDLWYSADLGKTWNEKTPNAIFEDFSGRANHRIEYGNKQLYMLAGRGLKPEDPAVDDLFNKMASSIDGSEWVYSSMHIPFSPRRDAMSASDGTSIYIFGGLVAAPTPSPAPVLSPTRSVDAANAKLRFDSINADDDSAARAAAALTPPRAPGILESGLQLYAVNDAHAMFLTDNAARGQVYPARRGRWYSDFSNESLASSRAYLHPHRRLDELPVLPELNSTAKERASLLAMTGATTILELSQLTRAQVESLRGDHLELFDGTGIDPLPRVCELKRRAQALVDFCLIKDRKWDSFASQELATRIQEGDVPQEPPPPEDDLCLEEPPIDQSLWSFVCRQTPPARAKGGLHFMDSRLYVFGGWEDEGFFANDLWVRDDVLPATNITRRPTDGGAETIIDASCSKLDCIFEARFFDITDNTAPKILRPWTKLMMPYDTLGINGIGRRTRVEIRGIDAAGNRDAAITPGVNQYDFTYKAAFPTLATTIAIFMVVLLILAAYLYWRRRQRLKALADLARRRLERKRRAKKRHRQTLKKVTKMKRQKKIIKKRPKADNIFSETDSNLRNEFKNLLRARADRSRESRSQNIHDPLAPPVLTDAAAPKRKDEDAIVNVADARSGKDAFEFDADKLALGAKLDTRKAAQQFAAESDQARRIASSASSGKRTDGTADIMRGALQVQSEVFAASTKHAVQPSRIPQGLAEKAAKNSAIKAGLNPDEAWANSSMKKTVSAMRVGMGGLKILRVNGKSKLIALPPFALQLVDHQMKSIDRKTQ